MCATCTILGALHTHPACQGGIACQSLPFSCKVHTSPVKAAGNINLCSACASQQGSQPLQRPLAQCLRTSSCSRRIHLHRGTLQLNAAEPHRRQHSGKPITVLKQVQPASRWQTPLFGSLAVSQELCAGLPLESLRVLPVAAALPWPRPLPQAGDDSDASCMGGRSRSGCTSRQ